MRMRSSIHSRGIPAFSLVLILILFACHGKNGFHDDDGDPDAPGVSSDASGRPRPERSGLEAAYIDDNEQYNRFLSFLREYGDAARHIPLDVSERIVLRFTDREGRGLPGAGIVVRIDEKIVDLGRTHSDGTFLFHPSRLGPDKGRYDVEVTWQGTSTRTVVDRQGPRHVEMVLQGIERKIPEAVPLDLTFVLDTTGSMGEEIRRLRAAIEILQLNVAAMKRPAPRIRYGLVLYRDFGSKYRVRATPFTEDADAFLDALDEAEAGGGGDVPEDLNFALERTFKNFDWNPEGPGLCFVITDAPPHLDYYQTFTYVEAALAAHDEGVKIFGVGAGGLDIHGEYVLRQMAQFTGGAYVFLTYGEKEDSEGGAPGSVSHHTGLPFRTDRLETVLLGLVKRELWRFACRDDQVSDPGDAYLSARKVEQESPKQTLEKLFALGAVQLVDYACAGLSSATPATAAPLVVKDAALGVRAEYFDALILQAMSRHPTFRVVDRADLRQILDEHRFQHSDLADEDHAVELGNLLGAKLLVTGSAHARGAGCEVFLKLLRVETAEVLSVTRLKVDAALLEK